MKVILLTNVPKVGRKYEVKDVANGYASNYLIPNKLAELASGNKLKALETLKKQHQEEQKVQTDLLLKNFEALEKARAVIKAKANEQGHLFQGVHEDEIVQALKESAHIDIDPKMIHLERPIKEVGEIEVPVLIGEQKGAFTLVVEAA